MIRSVMSAVTNVRSMLNSALNRITRITTRSKGTQPLICSQPAPKATARNLSAPASRLAVIGSGSSLSRHTLSEMNRSYHPLTYRTSRFSPSGYPALSGARLEKLRQSCDPQNLTVKPRYLRIIKQSLGGN